MAARPRGGGPQGARLSAPSPRRWATFALGVLVVAVSYAVLNRVGKVFANSLGVSLVYPASAFGVWAALIRPWETALGVFAATILTPWRAGNPPGLMLTYGLGNALEALLPGLLLRPCRPGSEVRSALRFVGVAVVGNTFLNAMLGLGAQALVGRYTSLAQWLTALWSWWAADAVAVAVVAFPVLAVTRQCLFLPGYPRVDLRRIFPLPHSAAVVASIVAVAAVGGAAARHSLLGATWSMLLFLFPLAWNMVRLGLPGAAWAYGVAAVSALASVAIHANDFRLAHHPDEVLAIYGNLMAYFVFCLMGGVVFSRNMELVGRLHARFQALRSSFDAAVEALAAAIEAKDPSTEGHVVRVADLAEKTARLMGIEGDDLQLLRYAALLHDVGKIAVPESVLTKPGPLSPEEQALMERHLEVGPAILERIGILSEAAPLIRYHEERYDGKRTGPYAGEYGLRGEEIPLGARIIAVADAFDAMTTDRPYRRAMSREEAVRELVRNAGGQFDPQVVQAFLKVVEAAPETQGRADEG